MKRNCPLCNHETSSFIHEKFGIVFHECPHCELIFKDSSNYINESAELDVYLRHQNSLENIGYVNYLMNFIEQGVTPFIQSGKALEFGSGPSPVLAHLLKTHYKFEVDIYDYYFSPHKIYEGKTYDLITSTEVIEHIQKPEKVFELFHALLNQQGILSLMTLFYPKDRDVFKDWFYIRDPSHVTFYTPKTMTYIAETFGFELLFHNDYRVTVFKKK
ncbi:MAG: class I SAM-dependent methyltransferase [Bacillota bacterium]|nr:MAG: class I SAM-dependent methyltransferase [Bacillota bacterium]